MSTYLLQGKKKVNDGFVLSQLLSYLNREKKAYNSKISLHFFLSQTI